MEEMSQSGPSEQEYWGSRLGVILAVAGSAVGFGNFLRFPGLAAQYGGGAFMIAYFISLLLLGFPVCLVEWSLGRHAGRKKAHTLPSLIWVMTKWPGLKYASVIAVISTLFLSAFYLCLEAWTLIYTWRYMTGGMGLSSGEEFTRLFISISGIAGDGEAFRASEHGVLWFMLAALAINFGLIYQGIRKGIEFFCRWAMPTLILICLLMTVRVLTLGTPDPAFPNRTVESGLAYMWEPSKLLIEQNRTGDGKTWETEDIISLNNEEKVREAEAYASAHPGTVRLTKVAMWTELGKPDVWLAAAGQVFFSLSVGFGMILTYASYLRRRDDVALSSLSAFSANEFCEVGIGGLMTVPAAVAFLGVAGAAGQSTFALGFNVLPQVFSKMPGGELIGFLFFFLLALAAVTSAISMLQPGIAYLEEYLKIGRKQSVATLFLIVASGSFIVAWFSRELLAMDVLNFWAGTVTPVVFALVMIYLFSRKWGVDKGFREIDAGAAIRLPRIFKYIIKYVSPLFLIIILISSLMSNIFGTRSANIQALLDGDAAAVAPFLWMGLVAVYMIGVGVASKKFKNSPVRTER